MQIPSRIIHTIVIICTTLMLVGVVWLSDRTAPHRIRINPTDEHTIQHDWIHLNETSILEDSAGRPYRWLVEQPKDAFRFINTQVDHSLMRMSVVLSKVFGRSSFWIIQSTLQSDTSTTIHMNGASSVVSSTLTPTIRHYQWLVPYAFVPQQDHLIPLTNQQFSQFGFTASQSSSSVDDQRIRLARWYGTTYQPIRAMHGQIISGILLCALWIMLWRAYKNSLNWFLILNCTTFALWSYEWMTAGVFTLEPIMTLLVSTFSWQLGRWVAPQLSRHMHIPIIVSAISFQGVYGYATAYWMQGVDLTAFASWTEYWTYIAGMRMAMPIPLLTIEYALTWAGIPGLWSIGYLALAVRIGMIVGVVWALAPWLCGTLRQQLGASIIMITLLAGTAFVFSYEDRNVWMVYDALFAAPLIWLWRTLARTTWQPHTLVGIGFVIVWIDALRPFMLPFTPFLVGIIAWHVWRTTGRYALPYLLAPLIITCGWHTYHIVVLGQLSWSSHTGFNIARAWLPDLVMQTMSQSLPDMNSRAYVALSNMLVRQSVDWIITNPWLATQRGITLLGAMLVIPVEMSRLNDGGIYTIITREIPWYVYGYRGLMIAGIAIQFIVLIRCITQRQWSIAWWNAVLVLTIISISAVTEYGEQARFIAAMAAILWFVELRHPQVD